MQTHFPEHPLLQDLINNGYQDFARYALSEREITDFPPYSSMALFRAEAHSMQLVTSFLNLLIPEQPLHGIQLLGPIPAPLEKIAGKYRYQIHIQSNKRATLHQYISQLVDYLSTSKLATKVKWSLDIDPIDMA